jgi:hypothetical protein
LQGDAGVALLEHGRQRAEEQALRQRVAGREERAS